MANLYRGGRFSSLFGIDADVEADAPGRVNLMGEHTDYHLGFVLPTVLPQRTVVELRVRTDARIRAFSETVPDGMRTYELGSEARRNDWLDYVQGVTATLERSGLSVPGFDILIASTVPTGGGVSSSAALEIALLRALRAAGVLRIGDVESARVAQRAEVEFVGAPVGIMDPMACSLGRPGHALFLDTRSLKFEHVPLPSAAELVVIDSGIAHQHAHGGYPERRRESFTAAEALGVAFLRDATPHLLATASAMPDSLARRARHVVSENARVLDAVTAMWHDDVERLGRLFNASHASMRDDYETSIPEIDALVAIGNADSDVYGARLTGGGFGGAVVMLARSGRAAAVAQRAVAAYQYRTGRQGSVLLPAA
jgi:galactokinase